MSLEQQPIELRARRSTIQEQSKVWYTKNQEGKREVMDGVGDGVMDGAGV